jgi:hypothetical protein
MYVGQRPQHLLKDHPEFLLLHVGFQVAKRQVFHKQMANPLFGIQVERFVFDDAFVLELFHVDKICLQAVVMLVLHLHYLNGKLLSSCSVETFLHHSVRPLPNLLFHTVRHLKGLIRTLALLILPHETLELQRSHRASNALPTRSFLRNGVYLFLGECQRVDGEVEVVELLVASFAQGFARSGSVEHIGKIIRNYKIIIALAATERNIAKQLFYRFSVGNQGILHFRRFRNDIRFIIAD